MTIHYEESETNSSSSYQKKKADKVPILRSCTFGNPFLNDYCINYKIKMTNQHWQLRNLIKIDSQQSNKAYYTDGSTIKTIDMDIQESNNYEYGDYNSSIESVVDHNFSVKCFEEKNGIIVSGGSRESERNLGYVNIFNTRSNSSITKNVGTTINNAVNLNIDSSIAYACNNDNNFYQLDVRKELETISEIDLGYALNYSTINHDHSKILVSGDLNVLSLICPKSQKLITKFQTPTNTKDAGFSIDFHDSNNYFASAFQSGKAFIYDVRNLSHPVKTFFNSRNFGNAAGNFRHLKFTNFSTDDYLIISEHQNRIHLIDMRNFDNHKIITLPSYFHGVNHDKELFYKEGFMNDTNSLYHNDSSIKKPFKSFPDGLIQTSPILTDYHNIKLGDGKYYQESDHFYSDSKFEVLGMDWGFDRKGSKLLVGDCRSLIKWDFDSWRRRNFECFEFA